MCDRFMLFLFKTNILFDLIILIVISFLSAFVDNNYDDPFLFTTTVVAFCYIIYFEYLRSQKNKISFFYNARTITHLRLYTIKSCIKVSILFFPISIILGILNGDALSYVVHYLLTIISFSFVNFIVPINIEKKRDSTIITLKDLFFSICLCVAILIISISIYNIVM